MTTKRITRSAATIEGGIIEGVTDPKFLTLTGRPANQRAFSIIRKDNKEDSQVSEQKPATQRVTRTRRSDACGVLRVDFPTGYTKDEATGVLKEIGLDSYVLEEADSGLLYARRSDLQSIATEGTQVIKINDAGVSVLIERKDGQEPTQGKQQLAVCRMEFNSDTFSREDATKWLGENGVDFDEKALDNPSGNFVLQRMDVAEGEETRLIELAEGVTAVVVRSDVMNIPDGFVAVISETAYSGWGWGQLDFNARLADVAIGEALREGLYQLEDLLRDVMFYSPLPVDIRKELLNRALGQFGAYATNLLDQLPRQLLMSVGTVQRTDKTQESDMSGKPNEVKDGAEVATEEKALTRADVVEIATTAATAAATAAVKEALAQRSDAPNDAATDGAQASAEEQKPAGDQVSLSRSDLVAAITEANAPILERMEKLETTTIVRSDSPDPKAQEEQDVKRNDPFKGVLAGAIRRGN